MSDPDVVLVDGLEKILANEPVKTHVVEEVLQYLSVLPY